MARTNAHIKLPDGSRMMANTDLHGHGIINKGEEFTARECWPNGGGTTLMKGGRRLRVRAVRVERVHRSYHIIHVEILQDMTPPPEHQGNLFEGNP